MEPTQHRVIDGTATETPGAAVVEIIERHGDNEKRPLVGDGSVLMPNLVRINGVQLRATVADPVTVHHLSIDGTCQTPLTVTLSLFVRALRVGEQPTVMAADDHQGDQVGAVIEIPDLESFGGGEAVERPYVYLNGHPLYIVGPIVVREMKTDGRHGDAAAIVTLTIAARRVVIDDEPATATISKA